MMLQDFGSLQTHSFPTEPEVGRRLTLKLMLKLIGNRPNLNVDFNPFRAAVPLWGQTTQKLAGLSPRRGCGPKRFNASSTSFIFVRWSNAKPTADMVLLQKQKQKRRTYVGGYKQISPARIRTLLLDGTQSRDCLVANTNINHGFPGPGQS